MVDAGRRLEHQLKRHLGAAGADGRGGAALVAGRHPARLEDVGALVVHRGVAGGGHHRLGEQGLGVGLGRDGAVHDLLDGRRPYGGLAGSRVGGGGASSWGGGLASFKIGCRKIDPCVYMWGGN